MGPKKGPPPAKWAETGVSKNQKKKEQGNREKNPLFSSHFSPAGLGTLDQDSGRESSFWNTYLIPNITHVAFLEAYFT